MPEYSSTTITPADGVQVPSMNGSTSGNFLLSALRDYILASKGQANGLASLGSDGKLTPSQLPDLADDVIVVASYAVLPATGTAGKIYITADNNKMFRWDSDEADYVELSVDLSEYAKLTDLAAEETARETADTNLNNAIDNLDHRLENLEQAKGDYVVSNYKDGSTTPSGKGKWCVVEGVEGVSRVENNAVQNGNFASTSGWDIGSTATLSASGNICTITTNGAGDLILEGNTLGTIQGHFYLVFAKVRYNSELPSSRPWLGSGGYDGINMNVADFTVGKWTDCVGVFARASSSGNDKIRFYTRATSTAQTIDVADFFLVDLNIYFNTSDLSFLGATDSAKLATIQRDYPHLLLPSDYGTRIVDWTGNGVRAWARNLWDEQWEVGAFDAQGEKKTGNYIISKNLIPVSPNTTYYSKAPASMWVREYDREGTYLGIYKQGYDTTFTTSAQTYYVSLELYGNAPYTTYGHSICLNVSDSQNGTYTPYHAPNTLSFPSTSLKSAGSVSEMYYPETGEQTKPIGSYTFTGSEIWTQLSSWYYTAVVGDVIKRVASNSDKANILCPGLVTVTWDGIMNNGDIGIAVATGGAVCVDSATTKDSLTGKTIYFELATPAPSTFVTPIIDNTLLTEAYGRLSTVQTGTVVDGIADLGFITL